MWLPNVLVCYQLEHNSRFERIAGRVFGEREVIAISQFRKAAARQRQQRVDSGGTAQFVGNAAQNRELRSSIRSPISRHSFLALVLLGCERSIAKYGITRL
jgi:hypothetical protein